LGGVTKQGEFIVEQVTLNIGFMADGNRSTVWRVNHLSYEDTSVLCTMKASAVMCSLRPGARP
jgi:hypothetical protein